MPQFEIHASAVTVGEAGILIRGRSGSGKSRLAAALIAAARGAGAFSRLIGDDRIRLEHRNGRLIGRGHPAILGRIEHRGVGIVETPFIAAAVIRLVIDLVPAEAAPRYPESSGEAGAPAAEQAPSGGDRVYGEWDFRDLGSVALCGASPPSLVLPDFAAASDLATAIMQRYRRGD
jgi:hypothetical protein